MGSVAPARKVIRLLTKDILTKDGVKEHRS